MQLISFQGCQKGKVSVNGIDMFFGEPEDAAGTTKYTYYPGGLLNLLNTEDGPWANDTVTNVYNNARLRSGLVLQQPTGTWTNGFTYDAAHRLSTVVFAPGTFSYTYKEAGNLWTNLALPNTSKITSRGINVNGSVNGS